MWPDLNRLNWYLAVPPLSDGQRMWGMQVRGGWGSFLWREVAGHDTGRMFVKPLGFPLS